MAAHAIGRYDDQKIDCSASDEADHPGAVSRDFSCTCIELMIDCQTESLSSIRTLVLST